MRLYIWSGGEPTDLAKIKAAKAQIEDDEFNPWATPLPKVTPTNCGHEGYPEMTWEDRVLAVGSRPPFICDYFLVGDDAGLDEFVRAMAWVLKLEAVDERANLVTDTLSAAFGGPVREVTPEEQEAAVKLREYQQNLHPGQEPAKPMFKAGFF